MSKIPDTQHTLEVGNQTYHYYSLPKAAEALGNIDRLPKTLKILLENQLRFADDESVDQEDMQALVDWQKEGKSSREIGYRPARVLMQDFTGVPGVVDLASMRAAVEKLGEDPARINPLSPVDLVIDHSVMVDKFGHPTAFQENVDIEMQRNGERYEFLRWGQKAFDNFSVVPPGTGICHQVNLEYLGRTVWTKEEDGKTFAYPDTLVGTDSHTTMINGLGVLGWGVGGIEAEAAMLGQPVSMLIPEVIGFKLTGKLQEGITATDLVLTVTEMLREHGVVGKFVEFFGPGLDHLSVADKATIANMAPEYGATCGFFGIDDKTIDYMRLTGRDEELLALVEAYAKAQMAAGEVIETSGNAFISVRDHDKPYVVEVARKLLAFGYALVATHGTAKVLEDANLPVTGVNKVAQGRPHIVDMLKNDEIQVIVNTTEGRQAIADSSMIRRTALRHNVFCTTTIAGALAVCEALEFGDKMSVYTIQQLHAALH